MIRPCWIAGDIRSFVFGGTFLFATKGIIHRSPFSATCLYASSACCIYDVSPYEYPNAFSVLIYAAHAFIVVLHIYINTYSLYFCKVLVQIEGRFLVESIIKIRLNIFSLPKKIHIIKRWF